MAITKLSIKYTDEIYATHADLQRALRMSLIGDFWKDIEEYRATKQKKILLKTIGGQPFYYVATPSLEARYNVFLDKLARYETVFEELDDMRTLKAKVEKIFMVNNLRYGAAISNLRVSDASLKALVSGMFDSFGSSSDETSLILSRYRDILKSIPSQGGEYSIDALAKHYGMLLGEEELTSFYREQNSPSYRPLNFTGASRVYEEAPFDKIEGLMEAMFTFQKVDPSPSFFKAIAVGYYFLYVKPFQRFNQLLACIATKTILGGKGNAYLPFEAAFQFTNRWTEISKETQLSGDLTYIILHVIDSLSSMIDSMLDTIAEEKKRTVEEEIYETPVSPQEPVEMEAEEDTNEEPLVEVPIEINEAPIEEIKGFEVPSLPQQEAKSELALATQKGGWSDKEIKDAAKFLMETHPLLRKQQALFFASHCTIGRYYSIQDYKKYAKCVYETARTSMDNLAREHLYKKLKIKNKYVYTPIKQGEPS